MYRRCGLVYPYDGRGFTGPKKKMIVGLLVCRVPGFLPSRPDWVPHILTRKRVLPPKGGATLARGGGGGWGPNSDDEKDTLVL